MVGPCRDLQIPADSSRGDVYILVDRRRRRGGPAVAVTIAAAVVTVTGLVIVAVGRWSLP